MGDIVEWGRTGNRTLPNLNNVRAALEWCFGENGNLEIGTKVAAAAAPVFLAMSLLPECYRWSQHAIVALDDTARGGSRKLADSSKPGGEHRRSGTHRRANAAARHEQEGLAIAERASIVSRSMLGTLSMFCTRYGEFKISLDHARRARAVATTAEEPDATALAQSALGRALHFMGDHSSAC